MMRSKAGRAQVAIAIVLLMCALAICTLAGYYSLVKDHAADPGAIVMDEDRFTGLRALLPPRGTVGYLSDTGAIAQNPRPYYLTQYFLAPVVVAPNTAHEWVVANCASHSALLTLAAANGLTIERDFPDCVALLRRRR